MDKTLAIAVQVNGLDEVHVKYRIKQLRAIADTDMLCYDEIVELNFLCLKILSFIGEKG